MSDTPWTEGKMPVENATQSDSTDRLWKLLEKTLSQASIEQRQTRRWGILFKTITLAYMIGLTIFLATESRLSVDAMSSMEHTAVVSIDGVIAAGEIANAFDIQKNLKAAFESSGSRGVLLEINSPGGSPVQSEYVYRTILDLKARWPNKPLHAVIGDVGASGAYYIAAAADMIHAAPASIVGSIGVVSTGFGFNKLLEKLGVDRRVIVAGENKAMLDPFLPESETDKQHLQKILNATHEQFIDRVREGRGERLVLGNENLFDGRIWNGEQSLGLGLVDSLASPLEVAREWIGAEERIYYAQDEPLLEQFSRGIGFGMGTTLSWFGRQGILNP